MPIGGEAAARRVETVEAAAVGADPQRALLVVLQRRNPWVAQTLRGSWGRAGSGQPVHFADRSDRGRDPACRSRGCRPGLRTRPRHYCWRGSSARLRVVPIDGKRRALRIMDIHAAAVRPDPDQAGPIGDDVCHIIVAQARGDGRIVPIRREASVGPHQARSVPRRRCRSRARRRRPQRCNRRDLRSDCGVVGIVAVVGEAAGGRVEAVQSAAIRPHPQRCRPDPRGCPRRHRGSGCAGRQGRGDRR